MQRKSWEKLEYRCLLFLKYHLTNGGTFITSGWSTCILQDYLILLAMSITFYIRVLLLLILLVTFHDTGWLIGYYIPITPYYDLYITVWWNPVCKTTNQGFGHCSHGCRKKMGASLARGVVYKNQLVMRLNDILIGIAPFTSIYFQLKVCFPSSCRNFWVKVFLILQVYTLDLL